MFDAMFSNPGAAIGTLLGFAVSIGLHYLMPPIRGDTYLYAGIVVIGFIAGLIFDARSESK
jgi:hypothetical protein